MTDISLAEILLRLAAALAFGIAIGVERQWAAFNAELQTNALVSLGSALFVVFGAMSFAGSSGDPRRVAAQVVTGIGFLCGGVILKQGATVLGLNTAATLWSSAAIGCLCAAGMFDVAALGTAGVVSCNITLRWLSRVVGRRGANTLGVASEYLVEVDCALREEGAVRDRLFEEFRDRRFAVSAVRTTDDATGARISVDVTVRGGTDARFAEAVDALALVPGVAAARWTAAR